MKILDLEFELFISASQIAKRVHFLAGEIRKDYHDKSPLFLPILNGSFVFAADLIRAADIPCRVSFVKHASYHGTVSSGKLKTLIGLNESLFNQHIILVEDIMDSGLTLNSVAEELRSLGTRSVEIVTLIRKAKARQHAIQPRYIGFDIDQEFVVGYGLDYEGWGRQLPDIYRKL